MKKAVNGGISHAHKGKVGGEQMKNLSISKKLIVGYGIILVMMLISTGLSIYSINAIDAQIGVYAKHTVPNITDISAIRNGMEAAMRHVAQALTETDAYKAEISFNLAQQDGLVVRETLEKYEANQRDESNAKEFEELRGMIASAGGVRQKMAELLKIPSDKNRGIAKVVYTDEYLPALDRITEGFIRLSDLEHESALKQEADASASVKFAWAILIACTAISALLAAVTIIVTRKSIMEPIKEIAGVYEEISKGNFNCSIKYESKDELGQLAAFIQKALTMQQTVLGDIVEKFAKLAYNGDLRINVDMDYPGDFAPIKASIIELVFSLNRTISLIRNASEQASTGAAQVSSGAQALAAGSSEQAASIEELLVAASRIADQAQENSLNIKAATQFVEQVGNRVQTGNEHMVQLGQAMAEVGAASNQIANITKVIEDIAFQTNILALNAAIEAAHAGSAGKGFAVVADEVRNLAAKSAQAAKQTGELIQNSVATVAKGTKISTQTAKILESVGEDTIKVAESFTKIEYASLAQENAIEQIKEGLSQVSAVVETNAATAEENSATSEEMAAQAAALNEEAAKLKLANEAEYAALKQANEQEQRKAAQAKASTFGKY